MFQQKGSEWDSNWNP